MALRKKLRNTQSMIIFKHTIEGDKGQIPKQVTQSLTTPGFSHQKDKL